MKKRGLNFFDLMVQHAEKVDECVATLVDYCEAPSKEKGDLVKIKETEADDVRKVLVDEINHTFITPIDREDLFNISTTADDLADYAWNTIKELRIYEIEPDARLLEMARELREASQGIVACMKCLEKDRKGAQEEAKKVKKIENKINVTFHTSIAELFKEEDIRKILKYREVYNHMNHASDRADHCADIILNAVVKL